MEGLSAVRDAALNTEHNEGLYSLGVPRACWPVRYLEADPARLDDPVRRAFLTSSSRHYLLVIHGRLRRKYRILLIPRGCITSDGRVVVTVASGSLTYKYLHVSTKNARSQHTTSLPSSTHALTRCSLKARL